MRLTAFSLENYGNFEAVRLALDPDPGHVNLVVAPNGGGKSVLRQAFRDLLFGIPGQTRMAFRFGYRGMQLFAEGIDENGAAFAIGRRKGTGNTLTDAHGNSIGPLALKELVGEADEALFERLFALDSHLLRAGAAAMLASGGDLAEALFAAGSGIAGVRRVRQEFETLRDQLAPERKSKLPPFYQALEALAKARSDLRESTIRPQRWQERNAELAFTRDRLASLIDAQARVHTEFERLLRIKGVRPWIESRQAARQNLAAADGAPHLPADTGERWREARQAVAQARRDLAEATAELANIAASLAAEQPDGRLLEEGERIDGLERARDQIAADHRDLPPREAEHGQTAALLEEILAGLGVKSVGEIAAIPPNGPPIAAARERIKQYAVLSERLRKAEAEAARNEREIAAAEADRDRLGEIEDTSDLAALVAQARAEGDPARRLADLEDALSREEARLAADLARVPLWNRDLDALAAVVPPARQMIDRAAGALASARDVAARAEHECGRLGEERKKAAERLAREREGKPVPDPAAVAAARTHRDLGWSLIRRNRFEGEALAAEIAAYAGAFGLAAAFERAIGEADDLADRRDEESGRRARISEQESIIAVRDKEIAAAEERLAAARKSMEGAARRWAALADGLGFADPVPGCGAQMPEAAGVLEFLAARAAVLDVRAARDHARHAVAAEIVRQEAMRRQFAALLPGQKCPSLVDALAAAQQAIDREAAARRERDQARAALATLRRQHRQALDEREAAGRAFANWRSDWQECLTSLKRPPGETPAAVEEAIKLIEEAHRKRRELRDLDLRIAGMRHNIADYEARVAAVVAAAAPDLIELPAEAAARELRHRLGSARSIESRRALLLEQEKEARAKLEGTAGRCERLEASLDALRQEIGGGAEEIESRIARAGQRRDAETKLAEIERKLAELGDGWPIETLEREAVEVTAEIVEIKLAQLRLDADRIAGEREEAARAEQALCDELQRIGAGEDAIDAEERRQAAIASLDRISAEALHYHAAACLLRQAVGRLRDSGNDGMVRRIGEAFARITGGAYAGVAVDEDDKGAPFLIAVEDGRAEKRVAELSEGTRDQLFLALRLVMLEDYAKKAPALPFIADDLLQTFDDYGRTANALAALTDLSRHVQVIVLSHQRQLLDAARALPAGTVNVCELAA